MRRPYARARVCTRYKPKEDPLLNTSFQIRHLWSKTPHDTFNQSTTHTLNLRLLGPCGPGPGAVAQITGLVMQPCELMPLDQQDWNHLKTT